MTQLIAPAFRTHIVLATDELELRSIAAGMEVYGWVRCKDMYTLRTMNSVTYAVLLINSIPGGSPKELT